MTSTSVNLQYDREKNEYIPLMTQIHPQYNDFIEPINLVFITEDDKIELSPPKLYNVPNKHKTDSDSFPFVLQIYIGALSVIGLYVVYRYVK